MTPFVKDRVDMAAYEAQVARLLDTDIAGFVTNGTTAEFVNLSLEEQMEISELVAKMKPSGKKLIVSACTANAADTVRLARHAKKSVLTPSSSALRSILSTRNASARNISEPSPTLLPCPSCSTTFPSLPRSSSST